jgi:hypothetical protein
MTHTPHKRFDIKGIQFVCSKLMATRPQHSLHEALLPTPPPLFWNPILTYLAIFISKGACRLFKTMESLLELEPPAGDEMYEVEWDPSILNEPFFQKGSGDIDTASVYSRRLRDLGFRANYIVPPTNHDFRAEGLHLIGITCPDQPTSAVFSSPLIFCRWTIFIHEENEAWRAHI